MDSQNTSNEQNAQPIENNPPLQPEQTTPATNQISEPPSQTVSTIAADTAISQNIPQVNTPVVTTNAFTGVNASSPPQPIISTIDSSSVQDVAPVAANMLTQPAAQNPMTLVLQWITYALWGWTMLVLSWVIFALVLSFVNQSDMGEAILYPISALMILLPASVIVDFFYGQKEPAVKKGGALVIMVIHAVIYILFMVGFLIGAVFSIVSMVVSSGDTNDAMGYLISCLLVSACYALLITRTLRPQLFRSVQ